MMRNGMRVLLSVILSLGMGFVLAQPSQDEFSVEKANHRLDQIYIGLATQNLDANSLRQSSKELSTLNEAALQCVKKRDEQASEISLKLEKLNGDTADANYLQDKKATFEKQAAACRLFTIRASEALKAYQKTIEELSVSRLFEKGASIWSVLSNDKTLGSQLKFSITKSDLWQQLQFNEWGPWRGGLLLGLLLVSVLFSFWLRYLLKRQVLQNTDYQSTTATWALVLIHFAPWILFTASLSIFLFVVYWSANPILELLSYALFIYGVLLALIRLLFWAPSPAKHALLWSGDTAIALAKRLQFLVTVLLIGVIGFLLNSVMEIPSPLLHLVSSFYLTLLGLNLVWVVWIINKSKLMIERLHYVRFVISTILIGLFLVVVVSEWLGYHNLASYLVVNAFYSLVLTFALWVVLRLIRLIIDSLNQARGYFSQRIRFYLGVKPQRKMPELMLLKAPAFLVAWATYFILLVRCWTVATSGNDNLIANLVGGFRVMKLQIFPLRIVLSLAVFAVIIVLGRWVTTYVARHNQFKGSGTGDAQVAMASIISYLFFAIAVLVTLVFAGLDLTSLAIIAGALSVGMGLGLQTMVNNFVSGIILLIEKPIKPGDRVIVGNTEGFVKKIRIRSTQITTLSHEDIIVPNADLMTKEVTNLMFRDRYWRVNCAVGVAYGSNIDLVKKILLEVGAQHPQVIEDNEESKVRVLFRRFGESTLEFELWCVIKDVNLKYDVVSDLNFAIAKAFRQHNITIAFPQRDLHIKDWTPPKPSQE